MSVPNFSFLACLEVPEKFGGGGEHVATMSNLNPSYLELLSVELSQVELGLGFEYNHNLKLTWWSIRPNCYDS